jgi:hypothetical protein
MSRTRNQKEARVRRLGILIAVAGVFAMLASVVTAGSGPRLNGKFQVDATIKGNDFGIPQGTVTKDIFRFDSPCDSGGCKKVKLDRKGGSVEHHYKSTLHKESKGVYKGTEGPYKFECDIPGGQNATFIAKHTIEVTKVKNGKAKKFEGKSNVEVDGCPAGSFIKYALKGALD